MSPESGRRFGPYEIQSRLGGGGMGFVYRAWDARLHREVAIKLLNHEYSMPGMRERFLREARAASALNHPNICTIFDIGEQDGDPYLVMELLQGETLKDRIADRAMSIEEIVATARETAEALGAAHSKGVIHRDVKPANIFLVEKPNGGRQAKVLDFGLAKIEGGSLGARQNRVSDLTTVGATVGTLAYMSPEQARGEVLDSRSDLFSLGVVLYEMATRHVPFQGATSALVFVQLLNHPPEPVREWNEAVPRELEKIIFKLLAKDRSARFQTALELEQALAAVTGKGSGGWLRKAVSAVPLVRAADPVARGKQRLQRSPSGNSVQHSDKFRSPTPVPPRNDSPRPADDQLLRPVARVPRGDTTPNPARHTPPPEEGIASTFSGSGPVPARRAGDPRPASIPQPHTTPVPQGSSADGTLLSNPVKALSNPVKAANAPSADVASAPEVRAHQNDLIPGDLAGTVREQETRSPLQAQAARMSAEDRLKPIEEASAYLPVLPNGSQGIRPTRQKKKRFDLRSRPLWWTAAAASVITVTAAYFLLGHGRLSGALLTTHDAVMVTEIENHTGDKSLDRAVAEGLRIALSESPWLRQRDGEAYRAARKLILPANAAASDRNPLVLARQTAERAGTRAFIYGTISGSSAPYNLHVDLRDTSTNDILASADSRADSLQQVSSAIDQVAGDLRANVGEPRASIDQTTTPLAREATANAAALALYSDALTLISNRQPIDALAELQQATTLDPHFVLAHLQLAAIYERLRAETAAAAAAKAALAAADDVSQHTRTLAEAAYDLRASGDYLRATSLLRQLTASYPHDATALAALAETLVLEGHMAEALQTAQQAYAEDPFSAAAYTQAESALIGLNRFGAAFQIDLQLQHLGMAKSGESLTAAYLDGRQDIVDEVTSTIPVGRIEFRPDWNYGIYLDATGHLAAGAAHWRSRAEAAAQNENLKSAASYLLAQGAVDRALLGECKDALAMARSAGLDLPAGRTTLFHLGLVSALCGDSSRATQIAATLALQYPQSFEVNGYYLADIRGALALQQHHPALALPLLEEARSSDLISVTPYLRGLAHVKQGEIEIGIVDLQLVLAHHGATLISGNDVYPAAQIAVARAFAASGDQSNSASAYRRFLELWRTADPSSALIGEARAHAGN